MARHPHISWRLLRRARRGAAILGHGAVAALTVASAAAAHEFAAGAIDLSVEYTADYVFAISGAPDADGRFLDNLDVAASFDLDQLAGWRDTTFFVHLLNNSGEAPNDEIGTLQGVDNIEVASQRGRLCELWVETEIGAGSLRAGLYDLNSEFYATESAGLLIAPAFGIGSEIAATGPNGPSIFPSTALAVRVAAPISEHGALKFAVINAEASVLGDPDGVDTEFEQGVLAIGELTRSGTTSVAVGAWGYSDRQDDVRDTDGFGAPVGRRAFGAYATLEQLLAGGADSARATTGFVRVGFSDGDTTPYAGGWQAGVLVERVFAGRADSAFSIGLNQGVLNQKFRANAVDLGASVERAETQIELTYSDSIGPVTLQPTLQLIHNPGADPTRDTALIGAFRLSIAV